MVAYIARRLVLAMFTVMMISVLAFVVIQLPEGDAAVSAVDAAITQLATPATIAAKPTSDIDTSPRRTRRTERGVADDGMSNRTSRRRRLSMRAVDLAMDDRTDLGMPLTRTADRAVSRR